MKYIRLVIFLLGLFATSLAFSQISHGGMPYFLQPSILRATSATSFIEMPSFNLDSLLREDSINAGNMRGSYRFAHKFYTHIDINDAVQTVLPDGTTVKQIGIRSAGAYSINLLLRDFEIPPGGKLFIYSADHSYVIGSFDYRNNSTDKILPVRPVAGEAIIVEYSEPADVPFKGHFVISEVNHDYRDIFRREPGTDSSSFSCMPDVLCSTAAEETVRSTVLLIINGSIACTGSLLNNTSNDGKPYLLTAVHCFADSYNQPFPVDKDSYVNKAGTIIAFFNYNRPVCDASIKMKGSEEMSLAGASPCVIVSRKDIALFQMNDLPPNYFNAYYAGWNMNLNGNGNHTNIHHPGGAVKKYGMIDKNITIGTIPNDPNFNYSIFFDDNSHWIIPGWTIGSTWDGSSGSPLFDANNLVIGGLTGGNTDCLGKPPVGGYADYFFALGTGWETGDSTNQLKTYLDPNNTGVMQYQGKDPNVANPVIRMANAQYTNGDLLITSALDSPNKGYVFGNSNLQTLEFAEEFSIANPVEIFGAYLLIPAMPFNYTSGVRVSVYSGDSSPGTKIDSTSFIPQYMNYSSSSGFSSVNKTLDVVPTETFVVFDKPVQVKTKKFFISYSINYSATAQFCVYNTKFSNTSHPNTAWLKDPAKGWITADTYSVKPLKTSLALQPLVRKNDNQGIEVISISERYGFYYDRTGRVLTLKEPMNTQGQIAIYSVGGQLLEKIQIQQGQTAFVLHYHPKGTIGIVKVTSINFSSTRKIIY